MAALSQLCFQSDGQEWVLLGDRPRSTVCHCTHLPVHCPTGCCSCGDFQSWDCSSPSWREQREAPGQERVPVEPCIASHLGPPQESRCRGAMCPRFAVLLAARQFLCSAPVPSACSEIIK